MGEKGGRRHLKRKPAPAFWPIHRKEAVWTVKPNPGPHPISRSLPLTLVVRDILGLAKTRMEAKTIISGEKILVDGRVQREELLPTGLMDVISIPEEEKWYRILPSKKGLILHPIEKDEADFKLCRIENKTVLNGGHIQLNLHDGRNIQIQLQNSGKPEEDVFQTLDTLKLNLPTQEIADHFRLTKGASAIITAGKNIGQHGKIVSIEQRAGQKRRKSLVTVENEKNRRFQTTMTYVFVVGGTEACISLPEAA